MNLPVLKHILVFTTWGQKCPHSEPEQFTFDNFQSSHPVLFNLDVMVTIFGHMSSESVFLNFNVWVLNESYARVMQLI